MAQGVRSAVLPQAQIGRLPVAQTVKILRRHASPGVVVHADGIGPAGGILRRVSAQKNAGNDPLAAAGQGEGAVAVAAHQDAVHSLAEKQVK